MAKPGVCAALLCANLLALGVAEADPPVAPPTRPSPGQVTSEPESADGAEEKVVPDESVPHTQPEQGSSSRSPDRVRQARQHFEEALIHYRDGEYGAAAARLRQALSLDPDSRDLVYNLGLVSEKLGDLEEALRQFRLLLRMESDPVEMERAERAIRRLEGAIEERDRRASQLPPPSSAVAPAPEPAPAPAAPAEPAPGRLDSWVMLSSGVSAAAVVTGVVLAVTALVVHPGYRPQSSSATSVDELQTRADTAHSLAVAADVALGLGVATGAAALTLYLARSPEAPTSGGVLGMVGRF